jgi:hypothetical protein
MEDSMMGQLVYFSAQVKGNCLDLVITNIPERIEEVSVAGRLGRSEHDMLNVVLTMTMTAEENQRPRLNWKRADWQSMKVESTGRLE